MAISGSLIKGIQVRPLVVFVAGTCIALPQISQGLYFAYIYTWTAIIALRHSHVKSRTQTVFLLRCTRIRTKIIASCKSVLAPWRPMAQSSPSRCPCPTGSARQWCRRQADCWGSSAGGPRSRWPPAQQDTAPLSFQGCWSCDCSGQLTAMAWVSLIFGTPGKSRHGQSWSERQQNGKDSCPARQEAQAQKRFSAR